MFREENEAVGALIFSDTVSYTLCVALSFAPYNIAFDCPLLCVIKITFVCLADWASASDTLLGILSLSPSNIALLFHFFVLFHKDLKSSGNQIYPIKTSSL